MIFRGPELLTPRNILKCRYVDSSMDFENKISGDIAWNLHF